MTEREYQCLSDVYAQIGGISVAYSWNISVPRASSTLRSLCRQELLDQISVELTTFRAHWDGARAVEYWTGWRITEAGIRAHDLHQSGGRVT